MVRWVISCWWPACNDMAIHPSSTVRHTGRPRYAPCTATVGRTFWPQWHPCGCSLAYVNLYIWFSVGKYAPQLPCTSLRSSCLLSIVRPSIRRLRPFYRSSLNRATGRGDLNFRTTWVESCVVPAHSAQNFKRAHCPPWDGTSSSSVA
jgi:hypothetical protein